METALMFFGILEENMETTIMGYIGYTSGYGGYILGFIGQNPIESNSLLSLHDWSL